jgi:hypothetical protein
MHKVSVILIALLSSTIVAQAGQTTYLPHNAGGAIQVASRSEGDESCSPRRKVLACVVELGAHDTNRWAYLLNDRDGTPNSEVHYKVRMAGASCAAMAYPADNVTIVGGMGDWFPGELRYACRQ